MLQLNIAQGSKFVKGFNEILQVYKFVLHVLLSNIAVNVNNNIFSLVQ